MARKSAGVPEPVEDAGQEVDEPTPTESGDLTVDDGSTSDGKGGYFSGQEVQPGGGGTTGSGTGSGT